MADIDKITSRPSEYLAESGVPQLVGGAVFLILGSSSLIEHALPNRFVLQEILGWIATCCAAAALLCARSLKQRIVFPRGGYVEPRLSPAFRFIRITSLAAILLLAIFEMAWPGRLPRLPLLESRLAEPGLAVFGGIVFLASGWQQKSMPVMGFGAYLAGLAPLLWIRVMLKKPGTTVRASNRSTVREMMDFVAWSTAIRARRRPTLENRKRRVDRARIW